MMPEVDGFAALDELRSKPQTANIPVIVATAKELTVEEKSAPAGPDPVVDDEGRFSKR